MRSLQKAYLLEPAGSHGVWGLDDYCFLPFLLGAWQLRDNVDGISPKDSLAPKISDQARQNFFYLDAIAFIHEVKKGPFFEHSPILNDIGSTVPTWEKVCSGLKRMYYAEVLGKYPVIQHFPFCDVLPPP
mmetsp:Transcript_39291/g.100696  ORF Transcript_39291/g.100696 Transcript_39291/m.100696 type:complete len:130 (-) Transcript_39291:1130-1519(-)